MSVSEQEAGGCPFCELVATPGSGRILADNHLALLVSDLFPVSRGHALAMPKRHIASFFDATENERAALFELVDKAKGILDDKVRPDGYNIGINEGVAAGRTIPHLHVHVIPRFSGDAEDPRGGIRWVMPERANYWDTDTESEL